MGLAISIGVLADRLENDPEGAEWFEEDLAAANRLLVSQGLPPHIEPRELRPPRPRASLFSVPYSFVHHLRRAYAHRASQPTWIATPVAEGVDPTTDPALQAQLDLLESHLICHSDAEGFYLPIDFPDVIFAGPDDTDLPGGMLGSSHQLLKELVLVAPALGIHLSGDHLSDAEAARIDGLACKDKGLFRELSSWLLLYEAARRSIQYKTAIVFS